MLKCGFCNDCKDSKTQACYCQMDECQNALCQCTAYEVECGLLLCEKCQVLIPKNSEEADKFISMLKIKYQQYWEENEPTLCLYWEKANSGQQLTGIERIQLDNAWDYHGLLSAVDVPNLRFEDSKSRHDLYRLYKCCKALFL